MPPGPRSALMPTSMGGLAEVRLLRDRPLTRRAAVPLGSVPGASARSTVPDRRPSRFSVGQAMASSDSETRSKRAFSACFSPNSAGLDAAVAYDECRGRSVPAAFARLKTAGPLSLIGVRSSRPSPVMVMRSGAMLASAVSAKGSPASPLSALLRCRGHRHSRACRSPCRRGHRRARSRRPGSCRWRSAARTGGELDRGGRGATVIVTGVASASAAFLVKADIGMLRPGDGAQERCH